MTSNQQPPPKAARKPPRRRILVTPSPEAWELIDAVHKATGTARAALVAELIDVAAPSFQTVIEAMRMLESAPREAQRLLQNHANVALGELSQAQLDLDAALDARTVKGKRSKRKGRGGDTRTP